VQHALPNPRPAGCQPATQQTASLRYTSNTSAVAAPKSEKVSWSKNTVWLDKAQTTGFQGVREDVWNFHIGGYQVCEKWLKDRSAAEPQPK
jgi:hypothetical protein